MNVRDDNPGFPASRNAPYDDPNAALWASITPPSDPTFETKVRRRVDALSPDMLAHRLRLALPGIFASHATAFYTVLGGAMALGASVGLLAFAALDALQRQSSASDEISIAASGEPLDARSVTRQTPSLRPAVTLSPVARPSVAPPSVTPPSTVAATSARSGSRGQLAEGQTLAAVTPPGVDDVDQPAPPRAKRHHYAAKPKARRGHYAKKRGAARRTSKDRTRNEKARALARALGT